MSCVQTLHIVKYDGSTNWQSVSSRSSCFTPKCRGDRCVLPHSVPASLEHPKPWQNQNCSLKQNYLPSRFLRSVSMAGPWEALMHSLPSMFLQKPNCEYPSLLCQWQKFFCPSNFSVPKVSPKFRKVWSSQTGHMQAPPTRLRRRNCFYILYKRSSISSKRNLQTPLNLCPLSVYIHGHHMDGVLRACN